MDGLSADRKLSVACESWALKRPFVISRGSKNDADVVVASISQDGVIGRGESVPYHRYGETVEGVADAVREHFGASNRVSLNRSMPAGAARNALDCALWDLEAKVSNVPASTLAGVEEPQAALTAFTISLGSPGEMAQQARGAVGLPLLKLKLGGGLEDIARMKGVRAARPDARLVGDANEAWAVSDLSALFGCAQELDFEVIEQPLPVGSDEALGGFQSSVVICADESVHTTCDLDGLASRYGAVNIKLDKAGGLTEALDMVSKARELGLKIMIGSMVSTSLAVAPAMLLAQFADWVDLDGPLLLRDDRPFGLAVEGGLISAPTRELWG